MKDQSRKKNNKSNQRIKALLITAGLLICCCIVLVLLINLTNNEIYKIDSRVKAVAKEKKKDNSSLYETIAWLKIQGTTIDTPIISYKNINAFDKIDKEDYLWNNNAKEKLYNQVNISGHNLLNLSSNPEIGLDYFSRFDDLMSFVYDDFAKENKYIQYTIDGKDYVYKIFGVFFEKDYKLDLFYKENYTKKELNNYIKMVKSSSIYDYDVDINDSDSVITLVTCTRMFGPGDGRQFVVVGRLLREDEKMSNYEMTVNAKYKEIKKIMKGDEQDDKKQEI